jgi:hypothetical protein
MPSSEIAERVNNPAERAEAATYAGIAANCWSQADMRAAAVVTASPDISAFLGKLELFGNGAEGYIKVYTLEQAGMAESKPKESIEAPEGRPELTLLKSKDAQEIATPSAGDKQKAEAERTNQSSGSLTELALKSRGLTREQVAEQLEAQGDSVSIDYVNGQEASRKTGLTEKELVTVGGRAYDRQAVVAYNPEQSGIVSDATNAKAVPDNGAQYEQDKSKIFAKPVEVQASSIYATGLDYNAEGKPSNKLLDFAQSAAARAMSPEARQAAIQGFIDKTIGIGEGLNQAKEDVKTGSQQAATAAWTALHDGSVARFMAQPHAINEPLFKTIGNCLDVMKRDPNAVNSVLTVMGRELEAANNKYSKMSEHDRGVQDGKAMFWFINPSGSTEAGELALKIADNVATHVDAKVMQTVAESMKVAQELAKTSTEAAQQTKQMLLDYLNSKGLRGPRLKLAGIPDEYFEGMTPSEQPKVSDTMNAMSKADDLGGANRPGEIQSAGKSEELGSDRLMKEIRTATERAQDELTKKSVDHKLTTYTLNPDQEMQKHKWFEKALGFNLSNKEKLAEQIVLDQSKLRPIRIDPWGIMYEQLITITGANNRVIENCRVFWQQDDKTGLFEFKNLLLPKKVRGN